MPMPLWFGKINKRLFNPGELRRGKRPVIEHVGRTSGKTYLTPLEVLEIDGGYIVVLVYGSGADGFATCSLLAVAYSGLLRSGWK